jgi:hypothetical protein
MPKGNGGKSKDEGAGLCHGQGLNLRGFAQVATLHAQAYVLACSCFHFPYIMFRCGLLVRLATVWLSSTMMVEGVSLLGSASYQLPPHNSNILHPLFITEAIYSDTPASKTLLQRAALK